MDLSPFEGLYYAMYVVTANVVYLQDVILDCIIGGLSVLAFSLLGLTLYLINAWRKGRA